MSSANGQVLQRVTSAPVVVYEREEDTGDIGWKRVHYLSVPASRALSGNPKLSLSGNPLSSGQTATVSPPPNVKVRFAEVLQNGYQVENLFDRAPTTPVPGRENCEAGWRGADPFGFYVARVIDDYERVGYSDPVYVAPPQNLLRNGSFEESGALQSLIGWQSGGDQSADFSETSGGAYTGGLHGTHAKTGAAPFEVTTTQTLTGLQNGQYMVRARVKCNGDTAQMFAETPDGPTRTVSIPQTGNDAAGSWWRVVTLQIEVSGGRCTVGFRSQSPGDKWLHFDQVEFFAQPTQLRPGA